MLLQVGLQTVLPALLLISLWRGKLISRTEWMLNVLAVSAVFVFLFLTATVRRAFRNRFGPHPEANRVVNPFTPLDQRARES